MSVEATTLSFKNDLVLLRLHDEKRARSALMQLSPGAECGPWLVDTAMDPVQAAAVFDLKLEQFHIITWGHRIHHIRDSIRQVLPKTRLVPLKVVSGVDEILLLRMRDAKSQQNELQRICGSHEQDKPWFFNLAMNAHDAEQLFGETLTEHLIVARKRDEGALRAALPKQYLSLRRLKIDKARLWPAKFGVVSATTSSQS
jgi:hypothetical protein